MMRIDSTAASSTADAQGAPAVEKWGEWDLSEILSDLIGKTFLCPHCGKVHSMQTRRLFLEEGLTDRMGDAIAELGLAGRCLVVFDSNTYQAAGERLLDALRPFEARRFLLAGEEELHAGTATVRATLDAVGSTPPDFLLACGSGCVTDTVRYAACQAGLPFAVFGTAASMDGYASNSSPLIVEGFKTTYPAKPPIGIFADTRILADAPRRMTAAGFGDVIAKTAALMDWKLARDVEGEAYCPLIASMVSKAVEECAALSAELSAQDPAACGKLMQVLSLTGIAIQMFGNTRPASGGEHHISHLFEIKDIQTGKKGSLHGDKVGIGTLISLYLYQRLFGSGIPAQCPTLPADKWEKEIRRVYGPLSEKVLASNPSQPPSGTIWEAQKRRLESAMESYGYDFIRQIPRLLPEYKNRIQRVGGPVRPDQLGYGADETRDAIAFGKEVRERFTILRIAERFGVLYDFAEEIAEKLPAGGIY